jgi:hypothetical protein
MELPRHVILPYVILDVLRLKVRVNEVFHTFTFTTAINVHVHYLLRPNKAIKKAIILEKELLKNSLSGHALTLDALLSPQVVYTCSTRNEDAHVACAFVRE